MALSEDTKKIIVVALANKRAGEELAAAVDSGSNPQAAAIAAIGATSNLSALAPVASALAAGSPTASAITDSAGTYANPVEPTGAEVDTAIDELRDKVETALDAKADQADFSQFATDTNTALDLKADNADVETLRTEAEARLDAVEAKIDAVIAALKAANLMAT